MSARVAPTPGSWMYLPPELRRMILEQLFLDSFKRSGGAISKQKHKRSAYAAVSPEWQDFFEDCCFRHLILHQSDLEEFGKITSTQTQRRKFVNTIWLRIELPEYQCNQCKKKESAKEVRTNKQIFTEAVWSIFSILSTWGEKGCMRLELSAHSPSDALHYCQELKSRIDHTSTKSSLSNMRFTSRGKATHGWRRGKQVVPPPDGAKLRVFGHPDGLGFDLRRAVTRKLGALPEVKVVVWLLIRRQFYRYFSVPHALAPIIKSLPYLEAFSYEPWRGIDTSNVSGREMRDEEHNHLVLDVLQHHKSLQMVSIFESFSPAMHGTGKREPYPSLGRSLAKSSQHWDSVYAAQNVDARDFFYAFFPSQDPKLTMSWDNLRHLCLSSPSLTPANCNELIQAAAAAALKMPKLRCMELWSSYMHSSCIFAYVRPSEARGHIELLSTWNGKLSKQTIACWDKVTDQINSELSMREFYLDSSVFDSYESVVQYLRLRGGLLHSTSMLQLAARL